MSRRHTFPEVPIVYEDEHLLVVDKPAGLVVHPGAGHAATRSSTRSPASSRAATRSGPGSSTASTATRPGLLVVGADGGGVRAAVAARPRARARAHLPGARAKGGRGRARGRIDAPIGRDRHEPTRISLDSDSPRDAVTHFEVERLFDRHALLRVQARDRADAPDPRPPGGDRPAGRRRPGLRRRGRRRSAGSSCTPPRWRSRTRSRVSASRSSRRSRTTSRRYLVAHGI